MRSNGGRSVGRAQPQSGWNSCPPLISSSCRVHPALRLLLLLPGEGRCTDFAARLLALLPKSAAANMVSDPQLGRAPREGPRPTAPRQLPGGILPTAPGRRPGSSSAGFADFDPEVGRSPGWAAEPETVRMGAVFSKASSVTHEPLQPFLPRRNRRIL